MNEFYNTISELLYSTDTLGKTTNISVKNRLTNNKSGVNLKYSKVISQSILFLAFFFTLVTINAQGVKAFPTVQGAGSNVTGGRGGMIVHVTTLADSGTGSLREALMMTVPRTIVFDVSGKIVLNSKIELILENSNFTIAGQTAPQGGITISNHYIRIGGGYSRPSEPCNNVIIRHIRFRNGRYTGLPDVAEHNGIISTGCDGLVIDHCSFSFCDDQALAINGNYGALKDVTIQNCIFSENATQIIAGHNSTYMTGKMSFVENAFIDTRQRTPNMGGSGQYDVINNYYFNWKGRLSNINGGSPKVNYIGNYMKEGAYTTNGSGNKYQTGNTSIYTANNYHSSLYTTPQYDDRNIWQNLFTGNPVSSSRFTTTMHPLLNNMSPSTSLNVPNILNDIGANKYLNANGVLSSYSDSFDVTKIYNAKNNISSDPDNKNWIIPTVPNNTRPANYYVNNPHIPEVWFAANVPNGKDHNDISPSGYTWFENYINGITTAASNTTLAEDDINQTQANTPINGDVSTNDSDAQGDSQSVTRALGDTDGDGISDDQITLGTTKSIYGTDYSNVTVTAGTIKLNVNGTYTYTPATNFTGIVEVLYTVTDDNAIPATDTATLSLKTLPNSIPGCSGEITSFPYSEGFENTLGAWTQSSLDDIDWTIDANGTTSSGTGPSSASQGTYYAYVEASGSGAPTKQAILNSPCFNLSGLSEANFSFKYHQYGATDMGSIDLEVSDDDGASWSSIWNSTGNKGDTWLTANVDLGAFVGGRVQLRFNRVTGVTWQADIAIDEVNLSVADAVVDECSNEITSFPYTEGFENTFGAWTQSSSDDVDWTVNANGTTSSGTGPSSASQGSYYAYVEASGSGAPTKQAILNSPCFNLSDFSMAQFNFKYHQYGATDMGSIDLEASDDDGASWTSIWNSTGNKGDTWLTANVDISAYAGGNVRLRFNRVTGVTWQADIAIDEVNLSVADAVSDECSGEITSFPYTEGFENDFGAWTQSSSDDIDWSVHANGTTSSGTGPSSASQGTYYAYVEASGSGAPTKQAILNSPCFNLTSLSEANFSFKYHQYGSPDMGSIDLEASDNDGASWTSIWNSSDNKGDTWLTANVDISAYVGGNVKLRFNRVTGITWQADIAIDDVSLSEGGTTIDNGCSGGITSFPYTEGFEDTFGAWTQSSSDDIDWTVHANGTTSSETGPSSASQGTYYAYVEASGSGAPTKQAILNSPCFDLSALSNAIFSFKYHQYGSPDMGSIDLEASDDDGESWTSIWNSKGNKGDAWLTANIDMSAYTGGSVQLRFNRITGVTWQADIAIDDVSLSEGVNTGTNGCSHGIKSYPYSEGFENTFGKWTQASSDDIDWTIYADGTPSSTTGPSSASQGTYYVYVEASGSGAPTKQAILNSPCFDLSTQNSATFSFDYHQFGASDMGSIDLEASNDNGASWVSIWDSSGNLGDSWKSASINLSAYVGGSVQLRFNRITGVTWQADIAIDNVNLSTGMARLQTVSATKIESDDIKEITLYPNPVKDGILNIKSTYSKMSYEIYNMVGQLVSKGHVKNNAIIVSNLERAIYQIIFSFEGERITKQFIKQ